MRQQVTAAKAAPPKGVYSPAIIYDEPAKCSEGIQHVLVNGVHVVQDGRLQSGVNPGHAVRAPIQTTKID